MLAGGVKDRFRAIRKEAKGAYDWTKELIDIEAHGLYELAKRKSATLAAEFDVNQGPLWDADLHQFLQTRTEAWPQIDWSQIPLEIRDGLRNLPRPGWWEPDGA